VTKWRQPSSKKAFQGLKGFVEGVDYVIVGPITVIKEGVQADEKWKLLKRPTLQPKSSKAYTPNYYRAAEKRIANLINRFDHLIKCHAPVVVTQDMLWDDVYEHCGPIACQGPSRPHQPQPAHERRLSDTRDKYGKSKFWRGGKKAKPPKLAKVGVTKPHRTANYDTSYVSIVRRLVKVHCKHQRDIKFDDALSGVLELILKYKDMERYDRTKSSLKTYVSKVVESRFTDYARSHKAANKLKITHSINDKVGEEKETELEEILCTESEDEDQIREAAAVAVAVASKILTPKAYEVFIGMIDGKSIKDIAKQMDVSTQNIYELRLLVKSKFEDYYGTSTFDSAERA
jgi:RNA polymerase sigma factor (sigma-70 family)